jgi:hypothetical protein
MRYIIPMILALSSLNASESAPTEIDAMAFGFSHHFNNRSEYNYNEFNPGIGLAVFQNFDSSEHHAIGLMGGVYKNSYNDTSRFQGIVYRYQFGDVKQFHAGFLVGFARISGYLGDTAEYSTIPYGAVFVGYDRINIDMTYIPARNYDTNNDRPGANAVAVWLRIKVAEF